MTLLDALRKASGCTRKRLPWTHDRLRYSRLIRRISVAGGRRKGISQRKTSRNNTCASLFEAAIMAFQSGGTLAPQDRTFHLALGPVYDALERFSEGEWMYDEAI